ncbi:glycine betaine ABC transporter substrate-binding protein [Glycomyces xiaoerkulensis]|uniref:glycine betaine ABC transporter substrate-binding protein n=1 Tax=Glycomyces xiaoerkulensis TaxID=2038139 RepID=UPI0013000A42|nr:glycine betaine ABC transporter substrate-binding protein [Glycomyces xiaoerkulensis]
MSNHYLRNGAISVDFGTSHTVVAIRRADGRIHQQLFDGSPQLPSAVFLNDDGVPVAGTDAVHSGRRRPERFEPNPKRRIDDGEILLGDREMPVTDVVAAVLGRVARECEQTLGELGPVTITVPAVWGPTRRHVVTDAAAAAGFGEVTLVPEPVAAASYFVESLGNEVPVGSGVVVYDLGGGTFDATALRRTASGFEVLAVDGAGDLGGLDFDQALAEHLAASVRPDDERWSRLISPDSPADLRHRAAFLEEVRQAKERLSRNTATDLTIPLLDVDAHLTRRELESVAAPLLERTVRITRGVVRESGLSADEIAGLFLVGAASRMPLAATLLHREIGIRPAAIEQPELAVSEGGLPTEAAASSPPEPAPSPALPPRTATTPMPTAPLPPPPAGASGWMKSKRGLATIGAGSLALLLVVALLVSIPLLWEAEGDDGGGAMEAGQRDDGPGGEGSRSAGEEVRSTMPEVSEETGPALPEGEGHLTIGLVPWEEAMIVTEIWRQELEAAGYTVDVEEFEQVGSVFESLAEGEIDLYLDGWLPNTHETFMDKYGNQLDDLGDWYGNARLTVAVPAYVDQVDSLEDLNDHADLFDGRIVGIDDTSGLTTAVRDHAMPTYGIEDLVLDTGPAADMLEELGSAIEDKEPIVVTLWQPHWAYDEYDLKNLEDPELTLGETETINALAHGGFSGDYPDLADSLGAFEMSEAEMADAWNTAFHEHEDVEAGVTAWLEDNPFGGLLA